MKTIKGLKESVARAQTVQQLRDRALRAKATFDKTERFLPDEMLTVLAALDEFRDLADRLGTQLTTTTNECEKARAEVERRTAAQADAEMKWCIAENQRTTAVTEVAARNIAHTALYGALDVALRELTEPSPEREKIQRVVRETLARYRP